MDNVLNHIISFPVVFYTVPLAICLVFWLSPGLGSGEYGLMLVCSG